MELVLLTSLLLFFSKQVKYLLNILVKSLVAMGFLSCLRACGIFHLGVTGVNALILAILGLPGLALLLFLQFYLAHSL